MRHPDWEGTISVIQERGGKPATGAFFHSSFQNASNHTVQDWVQDKIRSKFAFEGLCWEKSHIPEDVWRAGASNSNLIESVHADVNREGVRCTLLGGVKKGQAFDAMKMKTLEVRT